MLSTWRTTTDCVIYVRLSTGERKNTRQRSIPDQVKLSTAAAEKLGYRVIRVYQDGRSRGVRRQGLHDMLSDLEAEDNVGAVFIWSDTRLWGHPEQQQYLLGKMKLMGVRCFDSHGTEWKNDTPIDKLRSSLSAMLSEYETGLTAERIRELAISRAREGELLQRPPFGMKVTKHLEGEKMVSTWSVDASAMATVRRLYREFAGGKFVYQIAKDLNAEGVATPGGQTNWSPTNIRRTIDNPFYIGHIFYNRTATVWEIDPVTGDKLKHIVLRPDEDVIESASPLGVVLAEDPGDPDSVAEAKALWEECQKRRDRAGRERAPRIYDHRPLDGLVHCDRCGGAMHPRRFGNKLASGERTPNFDYRCSHKANFGTRCDKSHTMAENKIFRLLAAGVMEEEASASENPTVQWMRPTNRDVVAEVRSLEATLERATSAVNRVHTTNEAGGYPDPAIFADRLAATMAAQEEARLDLEAAQQEDLPEGDVEPTVLTGEERELLLEILPLLRDSTVDIGIRAEKAREVFRDIRINHPRIFVELR